MVAPGAGFCGGTLYRPKNIIDEDQKKKKRSSLKNELVFSPKVPYVMTPPNKRSSPTNQWVFGLKRKKNGVTLK